MAGWTLWMLLLCAALTSHGSKALDCGMAPRNTRIVGGENARAGSWPWQVSVNFGFPGFRFHLCGGTLISDQWVLTAAQCIRTVIPTAWIVHIGRETLTGPNVNEVNRTVLQIIIHPGYNASTFDNDIALIRLSSPVTFTDYIRPICLASNTSEFHNSTPCWTTGWGSQGIGQPLQNSLQEVQTDVVGENQCNCNYRSVININDRMICAGEENKDACHGDGGGPLQCKQGSQWIQAGITNFGVGCGLAEYPGVYARVSEFQTWIMDQVGGANVSFVTYNSTGTDQDDSFVCPNVTTAAPTMTMTTASTVTMTAAPDVTMTAAPTLTPTANTTTNSTASTAAAQLTFVGVLATVFQQHIVAP